VDYDYQRGQKGMTPLLSAGDFLARVPQSAVLPVDGNGEPDTARIETALADATGVIVAHLPWLLDGGGEIALPVKPQFAAALDAICADIALDRLCDTATGSENARNKYQESVSLLKAIDREYQGGLAGPGYRTSETVTPNEAEGIVDGRFFKKGGMY
jgi:phage gp36-like protein